MKDLNQIMRESGDDIYYTPVEVYEQLLDKSGRPAVINPPYERKTMTQRDMMFRTARNLCRLMKQYGIEATYDQQVASIEDTLRYSWYVPKMKQMGYKECVYVKIKDQWVNAFFVVTDTCEVVTASNIMILDAIECLFIEKGAREDNFNAYYQFKWHGHPEYEGSEHGIIATELTQLQRVLEIVTKPS